jgi:hypothetical protein
MKTYQVASTELKVRKCKYRKCGKMFYPKNDKAKFCGPYCKNCEGYLVRKEKYGELFEWFNCFVHNYEILDMYFKRGQYIVTDENLNSYSFYWNIGPLFEVVKGIGIAVPYGKYLLCCNDSKSYIIKKITQDGKNSI